MKKKVHERGAVGLLQLARLLRAGAKGKDMGREEFKQAWKEFKVGFDEADLDDVFSEFDVGRNASIDFLVFFHALAVCSAMW